MKHITFTYHETYPTTRDVLDLTFENGDSDVTVLEVAHLTASEYRVRYLVKTVEEQKPVRQARKRRAPAVSAVESDAAHAEFELALAGDDPEPSSSSEA